MAVPVKTVNTPPPADLSKKEVKLASSFRIKDALIETIQTQNVDKIVEFDKVVKTDAREIFDLEKLENELEEYIGVNKIDPVIAIALKSHKPLISGENITIFVDNQLQKEKLDALKVNLQNYLITSLNNGNIQLSVDIYTSSVDAPKERKLITNQSKYDHFIKINPAVEKMKKMFGLEME